MNLAKSCRQAAAGEGGTFSPWRTVRRGNPRFPAAAAWARPGAALNLSNTGDLIRTIIEATLIAAVVAIDSTRRRHRRASKASS